MIRTPVSKKMTLKKIRENDFVQNLWKFFRALLVQKKIADTQFIAQIWKGSQKKM